MVFVIIRCKYDILSTFLSYIFFHSLVIRRISHLCPSWLCCEGHTVSSCLLIVLLTLFSWYKISFILSRHRCNMTVMYVFSPSILQLHVTYFSSSKSISFPYFHLRNDFKQLLNPVSTSTLSHCYLSLVFADSSRKEKR